MSDSAAEDIESSLIAFAEETLGLSLYDWQADAISPFDEMSERLVQVTLSTPNGSGKSAVVIPALVLGTLALYPLAKVVLTTADGRQLDAQVMPALEAHRAKFPEWKFIEREIVTPTGGRFVAFTTDQAGRAEGWHKINDTTGPLLIIADEAKTVAEENFTALDRCTYNAILYASSPGAMHGRFYESHTRPELGFHRIKVGLLDCPHIGQDKIDRIIAQHGPDAPFTRSTLHGEFMLAEGEAKFDRAGLAHLAAMSEGWKLKPLGRLEATRATGRVMFSPDDAGWLWLDEMPTGGCGYLIACDPNTCEQGEGTSERDNTACCVIRQGHVDQDGIDRKDQVVAALHWPGGVKWDSDVLARRIKLLSDFYGGCIAVVEANNFGSALMKDLQREGVPLWRRTKVDDVNPNKEMKLLGYLTTGRTREHWVQACAAAVREQSLICRYGPACEEFQSFVILPSGRAEAQQGRHDDWVACLGIGLVVRCFTEMAGDPRRDYSTWESHETFQPVQPSKYGAC